MHQTNVDKINFDITAAEKAFAMQLEQAIKHAIQAVLNTADEAADHVNLQAEQLINQLKVTVPSHATPVSNIGIPERPSKCFQM
jgi:hypothetical protein